MRVAHCFDQWREAATHARRQRLLLGKVVRRWKWQNAKLMFERWRDYTQHMLQSVSLMFLDSSGRHLMVSSMPASKGAVQSTIVFCGDAVACPA